MREEAGDGPYFELELTSKFAVFSPDFTSNWSFVCELNCGETASTVSSIIFSSRRHRLRNLAPGFFGGANLHAIHPQRRPLLPI